MALRASQALWLACVLCAGLAACSVFGDTSFGQLSPGIKNPALQAAYVPLEKHEHMIVEHWGAGIVVAPHIAVTDAHNVNLIPEDQVLALSKDYDLLFFRTDGTAPAILAEPATGEAVIAYGQGRYKDLREAAGFIRIVGIKVAPRCPQCAEQTAIAYDAEAGPGFSGGPVTDAQTGAVVGLTFGFRAGKAANGGMRMFAYGMDLVLSEMHRLLGENAPKS